MKILFVLRHSGYVRNFESTLRLLGDRGHQVHLAFQAAESTVMDPRDLPSQLVAEYATFSDGSAPVPDDATSALAGEFRVALDYLRYLEPRYRAASKLRARAQRRVVASNVRRLAPRIARVPGGLALLRRGLGALERALPRPPEVD